MAESAGLRGGTKLTAERSPAEAWIIDATASGTGIGGGRARGLRIISPAASCHKHRERGQKDESFHDGFYLGVF